MQIKSNQSRLCVKPVNDLVLKSFNMRMACALLRRFFKINPDIFKYISLFLKIISYDQPIFCHDISPLARHYALCVRLAVVFPCAF